MTTTSDTAAAGAALAGPNPFVGPQSLDVGQRIFGRDREIDALYYLLSAERIVLLHSPSGAGKSSLIRAGLMPRLQQRFDVWGPTRVNTAPSADGGVNRYVRSANLGFEQGLPEKRRRSDEALSNMGLADYVAQRPRRRSAPQQVVLVFDQFEEILTADPLALETKREFFRQLGELLQNPDVWALFALREDYLAALDPYAHQMPTHLKNRFRLDLLGRDAAEVAMVGTAAVGGRAFPADAVAQLAQDLATMQVQQPDGRFEKQVGPHVEPLHLQVACRGLWERMPADDLSIDLPDIADFGNVDRALANYYDDVVGALPGNQRDVREWVGGRLITTNGIRSQVLKGAGKSEGLDNALIAQLVDTHLVRAEQRAGAVWYELAHDRMVEPVRESNAQWFEANLSPLQKQADLWNALGRPPELLIIGEALVQARAEGGNDAGLTGAEKLFLAASLEKQQALDKGVRQARRLRLLAIASTVVSVLALGAMVFAMRARDEATQQRAEADVQRREADQQKNKVQGLYRQAEAESLATAAENMAMQSPDLGVLLALEVNRSLMPVAKATGLIRAAQAAYPYRRALRGHEGPVESAQFSADGKTVLTASADNTARLWDVAGSGEPRVLLGHEGRITSAQFSPDGTMVLTASEDQTARLWDAASGKELRALRGHEDAVAGAQFSPDGKTVVTASDDETARLWDAASGKEVRALRAHLGSVSSAQFSADGKRVLTTSYDKSALVWDAASGKPRGLLVLDDGVTSLQLSADGKTALTVGWGTTVRLWDLASGKELRKLRGHEASVTSAQFSPDGKTALTASADTTARLWDLASGKELGVLRGHESTVTQAQYSADGKTVLTASVDKTARLWDVRFGMELRVWRGHDKGVNSARFSADGKTVLTASADKTARLWDVTNDEAKPIPLDRDLQGYLTNALWSADGKTLLTTSSIDMNAQLWDVASGAERREPLVHDGPLTDMRLSADGKQVLTASRDGSARLWDADGGDPIPIHKFEHQGSVNTADFSPDGTMVLTAGDDKTARLWDRANGKEKRVLRGHEAAVTSAKFSADGKTVLTTSADKTVRLWDVAGSGEPRVLRGHKAAVTRAQFSPDGTMVVTVSMDETARLWNVASGQALRVLRGHDDRVSNARFSADGKMLLTTSPDSTARLWDLASGKELQALRGHGGAVSSAQFSADGKTVLTAGWNNTARLWDTASGKELRVLRGPGVLSAQFSADGKKVLTVGRDNSVRLWDCPECRPLEGLADEVARKVGRTLTEEERQRFGLLKN